MSASLEIPPLTITESRCQIILVVFVYRKILAQLTGHGMHIGCYQQQGVLLNMDIQRLQQYNLVLLMGDVFVIWRSWQKALNN